MTNSNITTGKSVMNFNVIEMKETCNLFLSRFDDYQQIFFDAGDEEKAEYFVDSFRQLEALSFNLKENELTDTKRNEIRMLIKESEKMALS